MGRTHAPLPRPVIGSGVNATIGWKAIKPKDSVVHDLIDGSGSVGVRHVSPFVVIGADFDRSVYNRLDVGTNWLVIISTLLPQRHRWPASLWSAKTITTRNVYAQQFLPTKQKIAEQLCLLWLGCKIGYCFADAIFILYNTYTVVPDCTRAGFIRYRFFKASI